MLFLPILAWYGDRWDNKHYGNGISPVSAVDEVDSDLKTEKIAVDSLSKTGDEVI